MRKLALVGIVVMVGRGSVAQIAFGLVLSFAFFALHVNTFPLKSRCDNLYRAAAEMHVFGVLLVALILKSDLSHEDVGAPFYDDCMVISFVVCIGFGLVASVWVKIQKLREIAKDQDPCRQAFRRVRELGPLCLAFSLSPSLSPSLSLSVSLSLSLSLSLTICVAVRAGHGLGQ